jgi:hypothetical protein
MSADDEWWAVVDDPIEDALADCRNGHHGSGSVVLAEYVDQLRARVADLEAELEAAMGTIRALEDPELRAALTQSTTGDFGPVPSPHAATDLTASADHG